MKYSIRLSLASVLLSSSVPLVAGDIDPTTAPGSTNSYTIGDICNRLDTGAAGSQIPFTEPTSAPNATGCTFNDVMGKAPAINASGALPGEVLAGKKIGGLVNGNWGLQTGTLATQTPTDTSVSQPAGNYSAFNLSTVDTDLATGNIKSGVTVFGVAGDSNVVNTSSGDAVAGDIATGKKAWVDGVEITGTASGGGGSVALPKTGQTTSYATGDDGDLQKGATLPTPRFTDNGNGTVTDNLIRFDLIVNN